MNHTHKIGYICPTFPKSVLRSRHGQRAPGRHVPSLAFSEHTCDRFVACSVSHNLCSSWFCRTAIELHSCPSTSEGAGRLLADSFFPRTPHSLACCRILFELFTATVCGRNTHIDVRGVRLSHRCFFFLDSDTFAWMLSPAASLPESNHSRFLMNKLRLPLKTIGNAPFTMIHDH